MRQSLGRQRDHQIIEPGQPPLALLDQLRLEAALAVARHLEGYRTCLRQDGFAALAVPGIAAVTAGRIVLAVAEVIVELAVERRFDHHLRQLRQQPTLTGEPQSLGSGAFGQLPHQLIAGHGRLRLRRIQLHNSLPITHHIGHRCLLLSQELHRKNYSPAATFTHTGFSSGCRRVAAGVCGRGCSVPADDGGE